MAIYHMSAQVIGRSSGRSSTAAAAYRSGELIADERTGEIHDYTRKQSVNYKEIMKPEYVGNWATDRAELWNKVEQSEKRKDSQLAREINIAIPRELAPETGRELVRKYVQKNFVDKGMIADLTIHHADKENPHAHIMLTMREAGREGFGQKVREWNDKDQLEKWREEWAHCCNKVFEKEGLFNIQINHRSYESLGINLIPTIHQGPAVTAMEKRGLSTERSNLNKNIKEINKLKEQVRFASEASQKYQSPVPHNMPEFRSESDLELEKMIKQRQGQEKEKEAQKEGFKHQIEDIKLKRGKVLSKMYKAYSTYQESSFDDNKLETLVNIEWEKIPIYKRVFLDKNESKKILENDIVKELNKERQELRKIHDEYKFEVDMLQRIINNLEEEIYKIDYKEEELSLQQQVQQQDSKFKHDENGIEKEEVDDGPSFRPG